MKLNLTALNSKVINLSLACLFFISVVEIHGMASREAQQLALTLLVPVVFSLLLDNLWVSMFIIWSTFIFILYKCQIGNLYMSNIMIGAMLYLVAKNVKKENVSFFIRAMLWLCLLNVVMMACQLLNFDFIYRMIIFSTGNTIDNRDPAGFMGFKAIMGMLMALCVPLLFTRKNLISKFATLLLFIPIYISQSFIAMTAGVVALSFCLFFEYRKIFYASLVIIPLTGFLYLGYVQTHWKEKADSSMGMRAQQWKEVLHDAVSYPIIGWGLDSFRNTSAKKPYIYGTTKQDPESKKVNVDVWDNPHNLLVSLFYEWGIVGLIILIGYIRRCVIEFNHTIKHPNTIALAGFGIVVFIVSMAQFPLWLARSACFIVPMLGIMEVQFKQGVTHEC